MDQQLRVNAHATAAERAGLSQPIIAAVADGRRPDRMAEDEAIVYDFCIEVLHNQSVSDPTYAGCLLSSASLVPSDRQP